MKAEQICLFNEYTLLRQNPEQNHRRIATLEALLVYMNKSLIFYIARHKMPEIMVHHDEVEIVGMVSLLKAVRTYDPSLADFAIHAMNCLRSSEGLQSIQRFYACGPVTIPHNAYVNYLKEKRELKKKEEAEEESTFSEESQAVDTIIVNMLRFGEDTEDASTLDEVVEQSTFEAPSEDLYKKQVTDLLSEVIESLEKREREVINLLYGNKENEGIGLRGVGDQLNISHETVRKIRDKVLTRLKKKLSHHLQYE
jgi:RNA polymerase sigma factor (sigma-70 family)